jgi:hypothetical protein
MKWRRVLNLTFVAPLAALALAGCGETRTVTTSSTDVVGQNQQRLEHAVAADTRRSIHRFWKGRFRFDVETRCRPRGAGGDNYSCRTTIRSTRSGTNTCRIRTKVRGTATSFRFKAPLPFANDVFSEACPTLHSQLASS